MIGRVDTIIRTMLPRIVETRVIAGTSSKVHGLGMPLAEEKGVADAPCKSLFSACERTTGKFAVPVPRDDGDTGPVGAG